MSKGEQAGVTAAVETFREGRPVCIHDAADREGETDLVYPAGAVTPPAIARMRNDAGGLVCVAVSDAVADAFDLPFLQEQIDHPAAADHDLSYDDRSSFSLPVNHRDTYTGITDQDRALTISELAQETGPKIDSLHDHLLWERIVGLADNLGTTPSELLRSTPIRTRHPEPKRRSSQ